MTNIKDKPVENLIMKFFNLIIAPILLILLPLYTALITLGIFFIINIILKSAVNMRKNKIKWYRVDRWFDNEVLEYAYKTLTNYCLSILVISMFEVHILGIKAIEVAGMTVSLTRAAVILISAREFGQLMDNVGKLTDYNVFDKLFRFMPESLSSFFQKSIDYKKNDLTDDKEDKDPNTLE